MKKYNYIIDENHPVASCFGVLIALLLVVFAGPWVIMHAWHLIAVVMFGLPAMPYWTAFWGTWAAHIILSRTGVNKNS